MVNETDDKEAVSLITGTVFFVKCTVVKKRLKIKCGNRRTKSNKKLFCLIFQTYETQNLPFKVIFVLHNVVGTVEPFRVIGGRRCTRVSKRRRRSVKNIDKSQSLTYINLRDFTQKKAIDLRYASKAP